MYWLICVFNLNDLFCATTLQLLKTILNFFNHRHICIPDSPKSDRSAMHRPTIDQLPRPASVDVKILMSGRSFYF